jgi:ribose/xylose/arabinose/galactoside ABC-type transport system permease subunit
VQVKNPTSSNFSLVVSKYAILLILLLLIIVATIISPVFLSPSNLLNIVRQGAVTGMLAIGMTFVIISGGVDLSVGSTLSFCGMVSLVMLAHFPIPVAALIAVLAGGVCGAFNGAIIANTGGTMGAAFIITFGTETAYQAFALMVTDGKTLQSQPYPGYEWFGQGTIGIVPVSAIILFIVMFAAHILLSRTPFGRTTYCMGINEEATRLSGVNVKLDRFWVYVIAGLTAGFAAVLLTSRVKSGYPIAGSGRETDAIAAVVLGGTRMGGGAGSMGKTLIGVIIFAVLANALNIMGVSAYPQIMIRGAIILASIVMDMRTSQIENKILAMQK